MNTDDEWGRLDRLPQFGGLAGLYTLGVELRHEGHDPHSLGLLDARAVIRNHDTAAVIPVVDTLAVDLSTPGEIRLVRGRANAFVDSHTVLATGAFSDEHPQEWIDALAEYEQAALIISPKSPTAYPTSEAWLADSLLGAIGVSYWVDDNGFSIAPTEGTRS
jgi:hypothetical protein